MSSAAVVIGALRVKQVTEIQLVLNKCMFNQSSVPLYTVVWNPKSHDTNAPDKKGVTDIFHILP